MSPSCCPPPPSRRIQPTRAPPCHPSSLPTAGALPRELPGPRRRAAGAAGRRQGRAQGGQARRARGRGQNSAAARGAAGGGGAQGGRSAGAARFACCWLHGDRCSGAHDPACCQQQAQAAPQSKRRLSALSSAAPAASSVCPPLPQTLEGAVREVQDELAAGTQATVALYHRQVEEARAEDDAARQEVRPAHALHAAHAVTCLICCAC